MPEPRVIAGLIVLAIGMYAAGICVFRTAHVCQRPA
jgi:hypothetical protein